MAAGRLRQRITLQQPTASTNDYGETEISWSSQAHVWAEVLYMRSTEVVRSARVAEEVTHTVRIRYMDGPDSSWRVLWGDRVLNIDGIDDVPNQPRRWLILHCQEQKL
jgi:SPP1 family predicted phage head-tail adaptor